MLRSRVKLIALSAPLLALVLVGVGSASCGQSSDASQSVTETGTGADAAPDASVSEAAVDAAADSPQDGGGDAPAVAVTLSPSPKGVTKGFSTTLTWQATGVTSCTLDGKDVAPSGTASVVPSPPSTTYTLTCHTATSGDLSATATVPVSVVSSVFTGIDYGCVVLVGGRAKCWGSNQWAQLGTGNAWSYGGGVGDMGEALPSVDLGNGLTATSVTGTYATCAVTSGGVKCWGPQWAFASLVPNQTYLGDSPSEMGDALPFVPLGTGVKPSAVSAGPSHVCVLFADGRVKCFGDRSNGELGLGNATSYNSPSTLGDALPFVNLGSGRTALSVKAGYYFTCALLDNHQVKCWGYNGWGQLGYGDTTDRGASAGDMGDALPYVDLGTGRTAVDLQVAYHACALLDNGRVKCWGPNWYGQLGVGDKTNRGDQAGTMGDALPYVDLGTGVTATAVAAGSDASCAILSDGRLKCWGYYQQCGSNANTGQGSSTMGDALPPVDLGRGRTAKAVAMSSESDFTCALLDNDQLKCWGDNTLGELGLGDTTSRYTPQTMGDALPAVDVGP